MRTEEASRMNSASSLKISIVPATVVSSSKTANMLSTPRVLGLVRVTFRRSEPEVGTSAPKDSLSFSSSFVELELAPYHRRGYRWFLRCFRSRPRTRPPSGWSRRSPGPGHPTHLIRIPWTERGTTGLKLTETASSLNPVNVVVPKPKNTAVTFLSPSFVTVRRSTRLPASHSLRAGLQRLLIWL